MRDSEVLLDAVRFVIEHDQTVRRVEALVDSDLAAGPVAVRIEFDSVSVCVAVRAEDDTVILSASWPPELDQQPNARIEARTDLARLLGGTRLTWGWLMCNQQGYVDGLQLEFNGDGLPAAVCVQFIAIASALEVRMVSRAG